MRVPVRIAGVAAIAVAMVTVAIAPSTADTETAKAAGQPYAPNWFPDELLEWDPATDPDASSTGPRRHSRAPSPTG